jgi:uncharacterized protein YneR
MGASWTQITPSAEWLPRWGLHSVVLPDGSIILMGGFYSFYTPGSVYYYNDVWRSTDKGSTWTQMTAHAGWSSRAWYSSISNPDGSIVLMGGQDSGGIKNDVWRSTDMGASWTQITPSAEWLPRWGLHSVVLPDGSIVLMGGQASGGFKNDVWRFMPAGSSAQNPWHIYTAPGNYQVSLQVFDKNGYNSTQKKNYIRVISTANDGIAIFRPSSGYWYFDNNLDGIVDKSFRYGGVGDQIIRGDWQGTGKDGIAIFRPASGYWYFDNNLDGIVDKSFRYGGSTDQIIAGDWDGDGSDGIAIFRNSTGFWYFDYNLDGIVDKSFRYGGVADKIIAGKWV